MNKPTGSMKVSAKRSMRVFKIVETTFRTEPLFVTDCSYEEMRQYLNKRFRLKIPEVECNEIIGMMLTFGKAPWRVVWWTPGRNTSILVHELIHLVARICHDKGIPIVSHHPNGTSGDETAAYMTEFFYKEAKKGLRRKQRISC